MKSNPSKLNWKVAVAGGVALGAGFGTLSLAAADTTTPSLDQIELHASANPSILSLRSAVPTTTIGDPASAASSWPAPSAPPCFSF